VLDTAWVEVVATAALEETADDAGAADEAGATAAQMAAATLATSVY